MSVCEQDCNNAEGSFTCSCRTGFTLNDDGKSCDGMYETVATLNKIQIEDWCRNTPFPFMKPVVTFIFMLFFYIAIYL